MNAYEESKYEAELLVRAAFAELPIAVYRLSLLMGRAEDGYVHQPLEAHKMFELFLSGKARRIPGDPSHTLDMLPSDYAVRLLHDLFVHRFEAGRTYPYLRGLVHADRGGPARGVPAPPAPFRMGCGVDRRGGLDGHPDRRRGRRHLAGGAVDVRSRR